MRYSIVLLLVVVLGGAGTAAAQHHGHAHHGHSHNGHSHHGHAHGHHGHHGHSHGYGGWGYGGTSFYSSGIYLGTGGFSAGVISPFYGYGWGALAPSYGYYGWSSPYYGYAAPYYGGFAAPPVVMPAEYWYGPGQVRRLMGLDPPLGTPVVQNITVTAPATTQPQPVTALKPNTGNFGVAQANGQPPRPKVMTTNAATQARARKLIDAGDAAFQQQRYGEAFSQYKDATRVAPDVADFYLRQATALVVLKRYDEAAAALKLGLQLSTAWVDGPFRIAALYGDDKLAQASHLETLAQATLDRPTSDLLFLTGVMLYFGEAPQRAEPILRRAAALSIGETWHVEPFLKVLERRAPAAKQNAAAQDI